MQKPTPEQIAELKAEHGDVYLLKADLTGIAVVVKPPTRAQYQRFSDTSSDKRKRVSAMENLMRDCTVYPAAAELDQLLADKPGASATVGAKLLELAGLEEDATLEKL